VNFLGDAGAGDKGQSYVRNIVSASLYFKAYIIRFTCRLPGQKGAMVRCQSFKPCQLNRHLLINMTIRSLFNAPGFGTDKLSTPTIKASTTTPPKKSCIMSTMKFGNSQKMLSESPDPI